jgi:hypothetical protein
MSFENFKKKDINKEEDLFGGQERAPMTLEKLLEIIKKDGILNKFKGFPILVNGEPIDRLVIGGNGGINFVSKKLPQELQPGDKENKDVSDKNNELDSISGK